MKEWTLEWAQWHGSEAAKRGEQIRHNPFKESDPYCKAWKKGWKSAVKPPKADKTGQFQLL